MARVEDAEAALRPQWGAGPSPRLHVFFSPVAPGLFHGFLQEA